MPSSSVTVCGLKVAALRDRREQCSLPFVLKVRKTVLVLCAVAVAMVCEPAGSASGATYGRTPGTYTYYVFDDAVKALSSITFGTTVTSDPGRANVFWSHQFTLTNGRTGYVGFQRSRTDRGLFIYSQWGATAAQPGSHGTYCETFEEGGDGYTCRRDIAFTAGHHYAFTIAPGATAGWLTATITDLNTKKSFVLGSLHAATTADRAYIKNGGPYIDSMDWVEYFDWNDSRATCADEPYSSAAFDLPHGVDAATGQRVTSAVYGTELGKSCPHDVSVTKVARGSVQRDGLHNSAAGSIVGQGKLCLALVGVRSSGAGAQLSRCSNNDNQNFVFAGDRTIRGSWLCLGESRHSGAVEAARCDGATTQKWRLERSGEIVGSRSGRCLTVSGRARPRARLTMMTCRKEPGQRWARPKARF